MSISLEWPDIDGITHKKWDKHIIEANLISAKARKLHVLAKDGSDGCTKLYEKELEKYEKVVCILFPCSPAYSEAVLQATQERVAFLVSKLDRIDSIRVPNTKMRDQWLATLIDYELADDQLDILRRCYVKREETKHTETQGTEDRQEEKGGKDDPGKDQGKPRKKGNGGTSQPSLFNM